MSSLPCQQSAFMGRAPDVRSVRGNGHAGGPSRLSYATARRLPTPARRRRGPRCGVAFRSIASLSLSFGLVSIPVKVYSATESSAAVRFKLLSRGGQRVRRQYVAADDEPALQDEEVGAPVAAASASHAAPPSAAARATAAGALPASAVAPPTSPSPRGRA